MRYAIFKKSVVCYRCGLVGTYFAAEKNDPSPKYHFNLYGVDAAGQEIMLTRDHLVPKSKKGSRGTGNQKTCCFICNTAKSDALV